MDTSPRSQIIATLILSCILFSFLFYSALRHISKTMHLQQTIVNSNRIKELPPLTMPEVIGGREAEEMALMYLKMSPLSVYYRIPETSTLYLVFNNPNHPDKTDAPVASSVIRSATNYFESIALIDLKDPNRSLFTTLFQTRIGMVQENNEGEFSSSRSHEIRSCNACVSNGVPAAIIFREDHYPAHGELADPNRDPNERGLPYYGSFIALDTNGFHEIQRNKQTYEFYRPIQGAPYLFDSGFPSRILEFDNWAVRERYRFAPQIKEGPFKIPDIKEFLQFQALREDLIFGSNNNHSKIAFFSRYPQPVYREFEAEEFFALLPIQPEDLTVEFFRSLQASHPKIEPATPLARNIPDRFRQYDPAESEWRQWHRDPLSLYPLSRGSGSSLLVRLAMPSNPLLRIHIDKIATGALEDIVEYIGNCDTSLPALALANDQVILYRTDMAWNGNVIRKPESNWSHDIARLQDNNRLGPIETVNVSFPEGDVNYQQRFVNRTAASILPYDDDHLLIQSDDALYTLRWDGTEMKRVFPR